MDKINVILVAAAACLLAAGGALLDGPSEAETAAAQAADLADAQREAERAAQRFERDLRSCKLRLGPTADLIQIERSGDYVCREVAIEPTPANILHRYADLAGSKL